MSARPNLTKTLVELLKAAGVKASKRGKRAIVVDEKPIAQSYDAANGSIRLFVTDKYGKLPTKLAKPFKLNQTRGYAKLFKSDDDLTPAVEAIQFVAESMQATALLADEKPKSTRKTSTATPKPIEQVEGETAAKLVDALSETADIDAVLAAADKSDKSVSELNEAASTKQNPSKAQSAKPKTSTRKSSTSKPRKTSSARKTTSRKRSTS
jgi:hypothetical protein